MKLVKVDAVPGPNYVTKKGMYFDILMQFKEMNAKFCELTELKVSPKAACAGLQHALRAHQLTFRGICATRRGNRVFIIRTDEN